MNKRKRPDWPPDPDLLYIEQLIKGPRRGPGRPANDNTLLAAWLIDQLHETRGVSFKVAACAVIGAGDEKTLQTLLRIRRRLKAEGALDALDFEPILVDYAAARLPGGGHK